MKRLLKVCSASVLAMIPLIASAAEPSKASFNISATSEVPGQLLQPGKYQIHVVGRLTDRVILRVDDAAGTTHVDFIGIRSHDSKGSSPSGLESWNTPVDGVTYYRSWTPPGSTTPLEFVYPKAEAVSIAKVNQSKVAAIDPASEGRKADPTLSAEDMKLVTLWLLSSNRVGPDNAAPDIKAERYETASLTPPKPLIKRLPHTASDLPLVLFLGLVSLLSALFIRRERLVMSRRIPVE
jgi:hypothetical protein